MLAVIMILIIVLVGCNSIKPTIVGVWYSEADHINMTLNEDGTFTLEDSSVQDSDLLSGTYRVEGNQLLFTPAHETELANTFTLKGDTLELTYGDYTSTLKRVKK